MTIDKDVLVLCLMNLVEMSYHVQALGNALYDEEFVEAEDIQLQMSVIMEQFRELGCLNIPEFLGVSLEKLGTRFLGQAA